LGHPFSALALPVTPVAASLMAPFSSDFPFSACPNSADEVPSGGIKIPLEMEQNQRQFDAILSNQECNLQWKMRQMECIKLGNGIGNGSIGRMGAESGELYPSIFLCGKPARQEKLSAWQKSGQKAGERRIGSNCNWPS